MHIAMAFVLAWSALAFVGLPSSSHVGVVAFEKWDHHKETVAQEAGLRIGDRIVAIDGKTVTSPSMLVAIVHAHAGKKVHLRVASEGKTIFITLTPVNGSQITSGGVALSQSKQPVGYLGVELGEQNVRLSPMSSVRESGVEIADTLEAAVSGIAHVFTPNEFESLFRQVASSKVASSASSQTSRPESIVGVVRIAVQGTEASGIGVLLSILVSVNIFVGLMNMIPLLPLDGGYVAVATYERLRSRRGKRYEADVNKLLPVVYPFVALLLVLFACTLYLDIFHPIANPF
jgi:membrane-associated protease RseP (regulator of RpoE activity)